MSLGDLPAGWSEGLQGLWLRCMALLSAGTPEAVRRAHGNSLTVISGACDHCWVTFGVAYSKQGAHAGACWIAGLGRVPASRPPSRSGASSHRHAAAAQTMCHCHLPGLTCRDERDEQHLHRQVSKCTHVLISAQMLGGMACSYVVCNGTVS